MEQPGAAPTMDWVVDDLVRRVEGISHAVVLSRDGLTLGASHGLSREDADHLSAVAAGLQSLARGAGRQFRSGEVRQTIIELDAALVFVIEAGEGTCLAVLCPVGANPGLIAYEMGMLVKRIRLHLAATPRPAAGAAVGEGPPG
jgi:predicted regulator of Ras-like GTPase activity (Roadblock/LC7/MglB family)